MHNIFSDDLYHGLIIQGDLPGILRYLKEFPEKADLLSRYTAVFEQEQYQTYPVDASLNAILTQYQRYFRDVFYLGIEKDEAEIRLRDRLARCFALSKDFPPLYELEENQITKAFRQHGYHFLGGRTCGYRGPYIWKFEERKTYPVELPSGIQNYTVVLLDGFLTKSWLDFLSFGVFSPGGWTNSDGIIHCIRSSYDFDSENFTVSLLKHEAQHAMDLTRYPDLTSEELEYRAKLVELIHSAERNLLNKFAAEANSDDRNNGHTAAADHILSGFARLLQKPRAELTALSIPQIQATATELFRESEKERLSAHPIGSEGGTL